jgi:hypothetical protein
MEDKATDIHAVLKLYPYYDMGLRILARRQDTGVHYDIVQGYDSVIRSDFIPEISLEDYVMDMCEGRHPVAKTNDRFI